MRIRIPERIKNQLLYRNMRWGVASLLNTLGPGFYSGPVTLGVSSLSKCDEEKRSGLCPSIAHSRIAIGKTPCIADQRHLKNFTSGPKHKEDLVNCSYSLYAGESSNTFSIV